MPALMKACALLAVSLLFVSAAARAEPGDLDLTFASTGKTRLGFGGADDTSRSVAIQSDGRTVVVGNSRRYLADGSSENLISLVRYNTTGTRDSSFGSQGEVVMKVGRGSGLSAVLLQSDGKILVAGWTLEPSTPEYTDYLLMRFNANGSLDSTFDGDGIVITDVTDFDYAGAILLQSDGRIIVTGGHRALRYQSNGTLDPQFGTNGITEFLYPDGAGAVFQADGKIVVVGTLSYGYFGYSNIYLTRLTTNGQIDQSFNGGTVAFDLSTYDSGYDVGIQRGDFANPATADKLVVVGQANNESVIIRFNLDGSLDTSFNGTGYRVFHALQNAGELASSVGFEGDAHGSTRINVAGYADVNFNKSFYVARFNLNGTLDSAFDGDGIALTQTTTNLGGGAPPVMRSTTDKITLVGQGDYDFCVVRYNRNDGSPDTTWDGDGKKTDDVGDRIASARGVGVQRNGKLIVAGTVATGNFGLARFNANGALDTSFGTGGKVETEAIGYAQAVAIQPDDKIIVAGASLTSPSGFIMARYTSNGQPDTTFNGDGDNDGRIETAIGAYKAVAYAITLQSDGKILLAGSSSNGSNTDFALARYASNGAPDTSFNGTGIVTMPIGSGNDEAHAVVVQPNGRILVAGFSYNGANDDIAVARYTATGGLDFSFSFDGIVTTPIGPGNDRAYAMALQPNGRIVVAGSAYNGANNDFALVRYLADGTPDNSFNGDGMLTTEIGSEESAQSVRVLSDGKILASGFSFTGQTTDFAAVRYTTGGGLDNSFGTSARVTVDVNSADDFGYAATIDAIGRIAVAGSSDSVFGITRLLGDPLLKVTAASTSGGMITFGGLGVPGKTNTIESAPEPGAASFTFLANVTPDASGSWQYTILPSGNRHFYRLTYQ